jgi:uncharacterized protein
MRASLPTFQAILLFCLSASFNLIGGCESDRSAEHITSDISIHEPVAPQVAAAPQDSAQAEPVSPRFNIDSYQFIFDASKHSTDELLTFLQRVDEIASMSLADFDGLNIALVLQGPEISMFARENYEQNKQLVDLAARLDALRVIDMKVCQRDLHNHGYSTEDMPAFIERIPYGKDEMERLEGAGYYML